MKLKKNPKKDVDQYKGLYFVIGLVLVLALMYTALEWKTYDSNPEYYSELDVPDVLTEEVPITMHMKTLPPPHPVAPPIIEIIENDDKKIETEIISTEANTETEILKAEDITIVDADVPDEVPFVLIEDVPIFPGCEDAKDKRACFQKMMNKHISKNFRYPEIAIDLGIQGKVFTQFTIQKDGSISDIKFRGPDKNLEKEAQRILEKLPKMTPGKQRGTPVKVPFSIPINFVLQ